MKKLFSVNPDDLGDGRVMFEWSPKGTYLAAAGAKRKVNIYDRTGRLVDEITFPPPEAQILDFQACSCAALQWDPAGDQLAIAPMGNSFLLIWSASAPKTQEKIDTEFKTQEVSALTWARTGGILAVGTTKGNLLLYNSREKKKTPVVGKHTRKVLYALFNKDNNLALAGADKLITVSDGSTGETMRTFVLKAEPVELCVADKKEDTRIKKEENTYTINVARKTLYLIQVNKNLEKEKPVELAFQEHYGGIQKHLWFGDGYILVAFRSGYIVVVSSHSKELNEEVHSGKYLETINDVAFCPALSRVALGGNSSVKIIDVGGAEYQELRSDAVDLEPDQDVEQVGWTLDGQVMTVGTRNGFVHSYLASLPVVYDTFATKVVYLTSLLEISVVDVTRRSMPCRIELEAEPAFTGLGPNHAAVGINNSVWIYKHGRDKDVKLVARRDYIGSIQSVKLNETHVAALTEGRVILHPIEVLNGAPDEFDMMLPPQGNNTQITCHCLTNHFIITGTKQGLLSYYLPDNLTVVNEFRHEKCGIIRIWPQPTGGRLIFEDEHHELFLFNPVNDQLLAVPKPSMDIPRDKGSESGAAVEEVGKPTLFQGTVDQTMWDQVDQNVFVVVYSAVLSGPQMFVYLYSPVTTSGPQVLQIGKQQLPMTHVALVLSNGVVGCRLKNTALDNVVLDTHRSIQPSEMANRTAPRQQFHQLLRLRRLWEAWDVALSIRSTEVWQALGEAALEVLDLDLAIATYRQLGDASMVVSLERLQPYEDRNLLAAHILVLLERDYNQAQDLFLRSAQPRAALEMRVDLKHWQEALRLAEQLDPAATPVICKEHAGLLEMIGEYQAARNYYTQALQSMAEGGDQDLSLQCQAGICRCMLHLGDIRQGRQLAFQLNSPQLCRECGLILENINQLQEAAEMYERAGMFEKAATIYILTKNFNAAAPLMQRITSTKLHLQYAKAKESEGKFADAAAAYELAQDMDSVVRLCLEKLNNAARAYAIVRKTQSVASAEMVARHCLQVGDFGGAVEFLLVAGQREQAFDIAQTHQEMDTFVRVIGDKAPLPLCERIGNYYEGRSEYEKAGDMWAICGQHTRAVQLFLRAAATMVSSETCLDKAIKVVETTRSEELGLAVLDYIRQMGVDGMKKDEMRFKLNIAMGRYVEAAADALELARLEQEEGNYKTAHHKLLQTFRQMEHYNAKPSSDLIRSLMLLHSYILVKSLIAIDDHLSAARMLVRVARNISKFPKHIVPILTSCVVECQRAGLKNTAFEYAAMLMRPEYRNNIAEKYKKKIEQMVRKRETGEEPAEEMMACPFCNTPGPETELQCGNCQHSVPFDIASGRRMVLADWVECPMCHFPASEGMFTKIATAERKCPMCNEEVELSQIRRIPDPLSNLKYNA